MNVGFPWPAGPSQKPIQGKWPVNSHLVVQQDLTLFEGDIPFPKWGLPGAILHTHTHTQRHHIIHIFKQKKVHMESEMERYSQTIPA